MRAMLVAAGLALPASLALAGAPAPKAVASTASGGHYAKAQAVRGRAVYTRHCASCHGANLGGGAGPALDNTLWSAWKRRSLGELYALVQGSMPVTAPASLSDDAYADVIAYMLARGGYRAGTKPMPADYDALERVVIGAPK